MAFVDEIKLHAQAGKGGDGVVRWVRTKETARGGPGGGDGGRGGDVVLVGVRDLGILASYRYTKKVRAEDGQAGQNFNKHGKDGDPVILKVPVGTSVFVEATGETHEILQEGEQTAILLGGPGGFGNTHFKSSVNQNPFESTPGKEGQGGDIHITLKLIADAGFVGFPNAGKSSLLNALTRARSKVGAYPFTTLDPHLGDFYGYILADIPGLIEGASEGRGLGSKFLRHIERTRMLVHLVSAEQEDVSGAYRAISDELSAFGHGLRDKKEIVVLSKADLVSPEELAEKKKSLEEVTAGKEVLVLSVHDEVLLKSFSDYLSRLLTS